MIRKCDGNDLSRGWAMHVKLVHCAIVALLSSTISVAQNGDATNGPAPAQSAATQSTSASAPANIPPPTPQEQQETQQDLKDIHFDFDRSDLRSEDRGVLQSDADWLKAHPDVFVTIEGDADDRGDIVYNVALSDKRAKTALDAIVAMGVPADRVVFATGWGKLYPVCGQDDEQCWSQNRRAHFTLWGESGQNQIGQNVPPSGLPATR